VLYQHRSAVMATNGVSLCCLYVFKKDACQVGDRLHMNILILLSAAAYFDALCVSLRCHVQQLLAGKVKTGDWCMQGLANSSHHWRTGRGQPDASFSRAGQQNATGFAEFWWTGIDVCSVA